MKSIIPSQVQQFILRGSSRQVRIYPKGTRIESNNYNPVGYWRAGGQICAQNWQKFDKGMQLTRAMFEGTDGWLLKPENLLGRHRKGAEDGVEREKDVKMRTLTVQILGLSSGTSLSLSPFFFWLVLWLHWRSMSHPCILYSPTSSSPTTRRERKHLHSCTILPRGRRYFMAILNLRGSTFPFTR